MKKIILTVLTGTMLLSNAAFASTKTTYSDNSKNTTMSSVSINNAYHLNTQDGH